MKTKLLKNAFLTLALVATGYSYAQSVSFDTSSVTLDTNGLIIEVDGNPYDATTNPLKFSQVAMTADGQAMFCTLRTDWVAQANANGGAVISASNNTTLSSGTASALTVMGPGAVPASEFAGLTEAITVGQSNLFVVLRKRWQQGPNMFTGDAVPVTVVAPLSVKDNTLEGVNVYPNPAKDFLRINTLQGGDVKLFNILGALVKSENEVSREYTMNVSDLNAGVYLLRIESENKFFSQKIVID